jgi:hypothetical protein
MAETQQIEMMQVAGTTRCGHETLHLQDTIDAPHMDQHTCLPRTRTHLRLELGYIPFVELKH